MPTLCMTLVQSYWSNMEDVNLRKQSSRGVLWKKFSENMHQIYRKTPMATCDFGKIAKQLNIEITLWHKCSSVNLMHIFRTHFHSNSYEGLLLNLGSCRDIIFSILFNLNYWYRFSQEQTLMTSFRDHSETLSLSKKHLYFFRSSF